jgi:hypothetical protein
LELPAEAEPSSADVLLANTELQKHGAVKLFRVGYNILHGELCCFSAQALDELLASTAAGTDPGTAKRLRQFAALLKTQLAARKPWAARDELAGLVDILGARVVSTFGALLDEYPSLPLDAGAKQDQRQKARFVSRYSQVRAIRAALTAGAEQPAQAQRRERARPAAGRPAPARARTSRSKRQ